MPGRLLRPRLAMMGGVPARETRLMRDIPVIHRLGAVFSAWRDSESSSTFQL